jgi:hypothetical protein
MWESKKGSWLKFNPSGTFRGDGDGIPDDSDACPDSNLAASIIIDSCNSDVGNHLQAGGCTLSDRIAELTASADNHGKFVSAVAKYTNQLVSDSIITGQQKGAIHSCAARASKP